MLLHGPVKHRRRRSAVDVLAALKRLEPPTLLSEDGQDARLDRRVVRHEQSLLVRRYDQRADQLAQHVGDIVIQEPQRLKISIAHELARRVQIS